MKKVVKYIIFALIALLFIGTFVFLFKNSRPDPVLYQEHKAEIQNISRSTVVTGKIEPRNEVNIKPQINGIVSELRKEAGQMVKEGEIIAKIRVIPDMNS
ncbi:MAG: efflux RND transporter periplasmic adaptor subunit, partial [Bacteroidales bacterium]|nr:efflux RND transporter periplasmic adaptor subunit [Bacteroidales bacterium]